MRYTGASVAFTLAGILGASPAPYVATELGRTYGLHAVGLYLSAVAACAALAFWAIKRRRSYAANAVGRLAA